MALRKWKRTAAGFGVAICIACTLPISAQAQEDAAPATIDPRLNARQDAFMNTQGRAQLDAAAEALIRFPPALPEPRERRLALLLLDAVMHDVYAPNRPPLQEFLKERLDEALNEIENTHLTEGARIWKLYNHAFVVKTPTVTLGFDLTNAGSARVADFTPFHDFVRRLVKAVDILFVSHRHGDHADKSVAKQFLDAGKPVVAPPEVWKDESFYGRLSHLKREAHLEQTIEIQNGERTLKLIVYPGHQGSNIENNVPLIFTPEGMSFAQTGDQSNTGDFAWIDEVGKRYRVDVFMPNCWTTDIVRAVKGFDPELVITGHENELGHTIDHREPYALTYERMRRSTYPLVVMTWGESYYYVPSEGR